MEEDAGEGSVTKSVAMMACTAMALFYVAILYSPTWVLRLPPPSSFKQFMIRRFICAAISSLVSMLLSALILLPWQAMVFPLSLTSLMYAGSLLLKSLLIVSSWKQYKNQGRGIAINHVKNVPQNILNWVFSTASSILAWRNYVVAPFTEELVFRACMIPLLLCGGFKTYSVIFLCPIFFSLAHLNHLLEFYSKHNRSLLKAFMVAGLQLGYTVIFGSYASLLFIRTGMVSVAFVAGMVGFLWLLFPVTDPALYNDRTDNCRCWHGYCTWT
ncbi:CAAX prenyl protease 2 isoform X4 [Vitis vinifera]|uniref:CAAX prenyl protease 2 isoform X4 n=1 Tax=Vitis vinifera TaxID=29760 RepID=UPI002882FB60|nr:CAAX prenyl protease 2 isoform X4 [Vitis vinifera]